MYLRLIYTALYKQAHALQAHTPYKLRAHIRAPRSVQQRHMVERLPTMDLLVSLKWCVPCYGVWCIHDQSFSVHTRESDEAML